MSVVVAESWGGYAISDAVANALAHARARAAARGDRAPQASDVAAALLSAPDGRVAAVLTAVGVSPSALMTELTHATPDLPAPDRHLAALLARADSERRRTNDAAIGSIHLTSALAQFPDPGLEALRSAGIDADLLRTGVARLGRGVGPSDDEAFRPPPAPPVIEAPPTPALDELTTRTPMRRSAVIQQMLNSVMPSGPNATTSPFGKTRAARWAPLNVAHQLLVIVVVLLAVDRGVPWWLYPVLFGACVTPTVIPLPVWAVFVLAALVLAPPPLAVAVALVAAAAGVSAWYELWMKRVDLGQPHLRMRAVRQAARATGTRMFRDRLGLTDED